MENSKIYPSKDDCSISYTKMYPGDNNEIVCVKVYQGDWGHWDEKPDEHNLTVMKNIDSENLNSECE